VSLYIANPATGNSASRTSGLLALSRGQLGESIRYLGSEFENSPAKYPPPPYKILQNEANKFKKNKQMAKNEPNSARSKPLMGPADRFADVSCVI